MPLCAFEHQVLKQVGEASVARCLIGRADLDPGVDGHHRSMGVGGHHHFQAVGQAPALGPAGAKRHRLDQGQFGNPSLLQALLALLRDFDRAHAGLLAERSRGCRGVGVLLPWARGGRQQPHGQAGDDQRVPPWGRSQPPLGLGLHQRIPWLWTAITRRPPKACRDLAHANPQLPCQLGQGRPVALAARGPRAPASAAALPPAEPTA